MEVTFYSAVDPRRIFNKGVASLADLAPVLSSQGEGVTINCLGEETFNNVIPVYRDLTIMGKMKANFELHQSINFVLKDADLTNGNQNMATITIADDFTGTITVVNSKVKFQNTINSGFAIATSTVDASRRLTSLLLNNSYVEGITAMPIRLMMQGKNEIVSKSEQDYSIITASNVTMNSTELAASCLTLMNTNVNAAKIMTLICKKGPVSLIGSWFINNAVVDAPQSLKLFTFDGRNDSLQTKIALRLLSVNKAPKGVSLFYADNTQLTFKNSTLGSPKTKYQAAINNSMIDMEHTSDYLTWQLDGQNGLKLDQRSITELRSKRGEFVDMNKVEKARKQQKENAKKIGTANGESDLNNTDIDKAKKEEAQADQIESMKSKNNSNKTITQGSGLQQLNSLIGLKSVKKTLGSFIHMAAVNAELKKRGLQTTTPNRHMIFTGNPGTGKTTVARLVGQILNEYGALRTPHVEEVSTKNLISDVVGGTTKATHAAVERALGGILFIDEAYMLNAKGNSFAKEATDQLMADMENHREDLIVILAGYKSDMDKWLADANIGVSSRFPYRVDFPDYTYNEEIQIFKLMCKKDGLIMDPRYINTPVFKKTVELFNSDHANARSIRNLVEKLLAAKSDRIAKSDLTKLSDRQLMQVMPVDIKRVYIDRYRQNQNSIDIRNQEKAQFSSRASSNKTNSNTPINKGSDNHGQR